MDSHAPLLKVCSADFGPVRKDCPHSQISMKAHGPPTALICKDKLVLVSPFSFISQSLAVNFHPLVFSSTTRVEWPISLQGSATWDHHQLDGAQSHAGLGLITSSEALWSIWLTISTNTKEINPVKDRTDASHLFS